MRKELQKRDGIREQFVGIFVRYGTRINWHGFQEKTILLQNIQDLEGNIVADHLWFHNTKQFESIGELHEGDKILFQARTRQYEKGYVNYRQGMDDRQTDYRLSHPTKVVKIENNA